MKLCIFVGLNVGGYLGWVLGEPLGIMTAFLISGFGSVLGVYAGWKVARAYLARPTASALRVLVMMRDCLSRNGAG